MNKVYLIGRVTRDLELQHFGLEQRAYVKFTLAVNEYNSTRKEEVTNFIDIVAFGRKAEVLSQYIKKGNKLSVEGKIQKSSYIDKSNTKKYTVDIILDDFDFINDKSKVV